MNKKIIVCLVLAAAVAASVLIYLLQKNQVQSSGMEAELLISSAPKLNESAQLTLRAVTARDASNLTLKIILPEGFELVSGDLEKVIAAKANEPVQITAVVKATKAGNWTIIGNAADNDYLYVTVGENSSSVIKEPFPIPERGKSMAESGG